MPCLRDPSQSGPFASGFHRGGVREGHEQAFGRSRSKLTLSGHVFVRKIAKYRLSVKGTLRRHSKTICDAVVNQAAGSCSLNYSVSSELLSFRAARRRLSFGTTTTGVPKEDDVLSESDEEEDINNVDDHPDGDGGIAQAICSAFKDPVCRLPALLKFYPWLKFCSPLTFQCRFTWTFSTGLDRPRHPRSKTCS